MSVLDTFWILFKSNADEVVAGSEKATAAGEKLQETLNRTGEKGEEAGKKIEEENNKLAESFDKVKEHAAEWAERVIESAFEVAAAFEALFAVEKLVDNFFETAEQSDQLGERAKSIGVNVEDLDAWGNATKRVGGSADAFGESLVNVNRQLSRMEATGKSRILPFFKELGVAMTDAHGKPKAIFDLLPELAKGTEGKSKQESAGALRGIGFDEGTIRLLQRGNKEITELINRQHELGLVTAEDAETAEKFNIEWDDIKQIFHSVTVELDSYLLPVLERLLDGIEAVVIFLREHENLAIGFFIGLAGAVTYAAEAFGLLDLAVGILTSPITLVVAAIAALVAAFAFLYDDVRAFANGGKSVIGELVARFPVFGIAVKAIGKLFQELRDIADEVFGAIRDWVEQLPEGFRQWEDIIERATRGWFPAVRKIMEEIFKQFESRLKEVETVFRNTFGGDINSIFTAFLESVKASLRLFSDLFIDPEHAIRNFERSMEKILRHLETRFAIVREFANDLRALGDALNFVASHTGAADFDNGQTAASDRKLRRQAADAFSPGNLLFAARNHLPQWLGGVTPEEADDAVLDRSGQHRNVVRDFMTGDGYPAIPDVQAPLAAAKDALNNANSPLMAQTSASLAAGAGGTVNNTVNVGSTTINAQSSDPDAIGRVVDDRLAHHVETAITQLSSGVSH